MRCVYCKKNEATKTYELIKNGVQAVEYYCMDCYSSRFLTEGQEDAASFSVCAYCGTTAEEVLKTKLVGCAHCYQSMRGKISPLVVKMQGIKGHSGKTPPLEYEEENSLGGAIYDEMLRKNAMEKAQFERQKNELELIIAKLQKENNYGDAKGYASKLSNMKSNGVVEEGFVWHTRPTLLNR